MQPDTKYLTTDEAARYMRVHPETVRRWARQRLIRFTRAPGGRRMMFTLAALEAASTQEEAGNG